MSDKKPNPKNTSQKPAGAQAGENGGHPPPQHDGGKKFSWRTLVIFVCSEGFGVPLAIAGGDHAVKLEFVPALIGFGFGIPLMAAGFIYLFFEQRIAKPTREHLHAVAYRWLPVSVLFAFAYVVGPNIYQRAVGLNLPRSQEQPNAQYTHQPIPADQMQFRIELRTFVLSKLETLWDGWNAAEAATIRASEKKNGGIDGHTRIWETLDSVTVVAAYQALEQAAKMPIESYDDTDLQRKIVEFVQRYRDWQDNIKTFHQAEGISPDGVFDQLLDADKQALAALRDLKAQPRADILRNGADDATMASRRGIFSR